MGIEVPELRRKFQLLKSYGVITSIKSIADKVGRAEKTLWGWADGNATTEANRVPPNNFEAFRIAFIEVLEDHVLPERAEALLFGPASHLENELRRTKGPQTPSLLELIEAEADRTAIRIRLANDQKNERGLIETQLDRSPSEPQYIVKREEWFRLFIERDFRALNIIALQNGSALWGAVPWAFDRDRGKLLLPGFMQSGAPAFMRERNSIGLNIFAVVATRQPPPSGIMDVMAGQQVLDQTAIATLADFVRRQPKAGRQMFSITVTIE